MRIIFYSFFSIFFLMKFDRLIVAVVTDMGDALTHVFPEEPSDDRLPPESYGYAQKFKTVKLLAGWFFRLILNQTELKSFWNW